MKRIIHALVVCILCLAPATLPALIMTGDGNKPVRDAGWPEGALAVANLESRVGWWEGPPFGGGEYHFMYRGDTDTFAKTLAAFAAMRAPVLELVVHDGPEECIFLGGSNNTNANKRVDWAFVVWVPASWHQLFNNPKTSFGADQPQFRQPVAPPRLDVYIGGGGQVDWAKVKVPAHLQVRDERAALQALQPVGGALVQAEVYDMATGKPVSGARVIVAKQGARDARNRRDHETVAEGAGGDDGRIEVGKIPEGNHYVTIEAAGYAPRMVGHAKFGRSTVKKYTVELAKAETQRGVLIDSDGKPLKNVKITIGELLALNGRGYAMPRSPEAVTDDQGVFTFADMPKGYAQFWVHEPNYFFGDSFTIHDVPEKDLVLRLSKAGGLVVTITDKAGKPLSKFEGNPLIVDLEPVTGNKIGSWGGGGTVQDNGMFEYKVLPPGEYRLISRPNPGSTKRKYTPEQIVKITPGAPVKVTMVYE